MKPLLRTKVAPSRQGENILNKSLCNQLLQQGSLPHKIKRSELNDSVDLINQSLLPRKSDILERTYLGSEDKHNSSFAFADRSFQHPNKQAKSKPKTSQNNSLIKENIKTRMKTHGDNHRGVSPILKSSESPIENFFFHTDENEITSKKQQESPEKAPSQFRRKATSQMKSRVPVGNHETSILKEINQSMNMEVAKKQRANSIRRPSSSKPKKVQSSQVNKSGILNRRDSEATRSMISEEDSTKPSLHDRSKLLEKSFQTCIDTKGTKETEKTAKSGKLDFAELSEKELMEMSSSLITYSDLLIERDQTNSRLLCYMKENFGIVMKEFLKNYQSMKQFEVMKKQYEEEKLRSKKETEMLEFKLKVLQTENDRLKDLNRKFTQYEETQMRESTIGDESVYSQNLRGMINEEQNLVRQLDKKEKTISLLKAKEEKYVMLLNAIEAQGVNIDQIYEEERMRTLHTQEILETRMDDFSDLRTKSSIDCNQSTKTTNNGKEVQQQMLQSKKNKEEKSKFAPKQIRQETAPTYGQEYWERQFTEASNSKALSQFSDSMNFQQPEQAEHLIAYSPLDYQGDLIPTKEEKPRARSNSKTKSKTKKTIKKKENSVDMKGRFKLDLSSINDKSIKQYHDEFMDKYSEFASSWKRAMKHDKTYQHD